MELDMLNLEKIFAVKRNNQNTVLIVVDDNRVYLGWKEAEEYAKAHRYSTSAITEPSSKMEIRWLVLSTSDLWTITVFFNRRKRKIITVNGEGRIIEEYINYCQPKSNKKSHNNKSSSKKKKSSEKKKNTGSWNEQKRRGIADQNKSHVRVTKRKSKQSVRVISSGSVFDTGTSSSYKKANPVNTSVSITDAGKHAAKVEESRKFVDKELHPHGMRYGDASKYRKMGKKWQ